MDQISQIARWHEGRKGKGKSARCTKDLALQILASTDERGMGEAFRDAVAYASGVVADRHLGLLEDILGN